MAGPICAIAAIGLALVAAPVRAQTATAATAELFETSDPTLRASLDRIAKGSRLWREAASAVAVKGRRVLVLTSEQVRVADAPNTPAKDGFDPTVLAEAAPVVGADGQVQVVLVVVNLSLLEDTHWSRGSLLAEVEADLDRILVHEIYGHAVPYLMAGSVSGRCPDPAPSQRAANACSIQRENMVRAELGLGRRTDYGLDGLALIRRDRY